VVQAFDFVSYLDGAPFDFFKGCGFRVDAITMLVRMVPFSLSILIDILNNLGHAVLLFTGQLDWFFSSLTTEPQVQAQAGTIRRPPSSPLFLIFIKSLP